MKRSVIGALFILLVACLPANAQSVDLIYGVGKNFDIPSATFQNFHIPAIEISAKDVTLNVAHQLTMKGESSETDLTASYSRTLTDRLKLSMNAGYWRYHFPFTYGKDRKYDIRYYVEGRIRIKQ